MSFELLGKPFDINVSRKTLRIDLFDSRREDVIDVVISQQRGVFGQVARVVLEIFTWSKMRWIHKNRNYNDVTHPPRFAHETQVSFVQRAHRRNQSHSLILFTANFARDGTHALTTVDDLHS